MNNSRFVYRASGSNSYSVFDTTQKNEFGETYCVVTQTSFHEAMKITNELNCVYPHIREKALKSFGLE